MFSIVSRKVYFFSVKYLIEFRANLFFWKPYIYFIFSLWEENNLKFKKNLVRTLSCKTFFLLTHLCTSVYQELYIMNIFSVNLYICIISIFQTIHIYWYLYIKQTFYSIEVLLNLKLMSITEIFVVHSVHIRWLKIR